MKIACTTPAFSRPLMLAVLVPAVAAAQPVDWMRFYNGPPGGVDAAFAVVEMSGTAAGGAAVTGRSRGTSWHDDFAVVRYNAQGDQLWSARYDNGGQDFSFLVGADSEGNVYVAGDSYGNDNFDYALIKYSPTGERLWVRRYNGPGNMDDLPEAMVVDAAGNIYIAGYSFKEFQANNTIASHFHIIKYDTHGDIVWQHHLSGDPHLGAGANAITLDPHGNIYAAGGIRAQAAFGPDPNFFTVKVDASGVIAWTRQYSTPGPFTEQDNGQLIAVDHEGNVFVAGQSDGGMERSWDTTILKYNAAGDLQWVRTMDLPRPDGPTAIDVDAQGNLYIAGIWNKATDDDGFVVSYSAAGAERWRRFIDGGLNWGSDATYSMRVGPDGSIYAASEIDHSSGVDLSLTRYSPAGDIIAHTLYPSGASGNFVWGKNTCLDIAPDGAAYIVGSRHAASVDFITIKTEALILPCYANCDGSTSEPLLNIDDFTCFINRYAEATGLPHAQQVSHYANCDGSTTAPVLNVDDFTCFINRFAQGCP
jgi:uncharacterized delta-60 repeat protein